MDKETKKYLEAMEDRLDSRFQKMQSENNKWFLKIYHQGNRHRSEDRWPLRKE